MTGALRTVQKLAVRLIIAHRCVSSHAHVPSSHSVDSSLAYTAQLNHCAVDRSMALVDSDYKLQCGFRWVADPAWPLNAATPVSAGRLLQRRRCSVGPV